MALKLVRTENNDDRLYPHFKALDLLDVTVLTGLNGSGKSQFLKSIKEKRWIIEALEDVEIVAIDRDDLSFPFGSNGRSVSVPNLRACLADPKFLDLSRRLVDRGDDHTSIKYWTDYRDGFTNFLDLYGNTDGSPGYGSAVSFAMQKKRALHLFTESDVEECESTLVGNQITVSLSSLYSSFLDARRKAWANELRSASLTGDLPATTIAELHKQFDLDFKPPWEILNNALAELFALDSKGALFDFQVSHPNLLDHLVPYTSDTKFEPAIISRTGLGRTVDELSSGEKSIFKFLMICASKVTLPKKSCLFLIDELDASLHPSLQEFFIRMITYLSEEYLTKFIVCTHSPTTVALSPHEQVLLFSAHNNERKHEFTSKENAVEQLSGGAVTLASALKIVHTYGDQEGLIFTEGKNVSILKSVLRVFGIKGIEVFSGFESQSGFTQLRTLYQLFKLLHWKGFVFFILDCDVPDDERRKWSSQDEKVRYHFLSKRSDGAFATGIENAFSIPFVREFLSLAHDRPLPSKLSSKQKREFTGFVETRGSLENLDHFSEVRDILLTLQSLRLSADEPLKMNDPKHCEGEQ